MRIGQPSAFGQNPGTDKPERQKIKGPVQAGPAYVFLHVGKTGGTFLKNIVGMRNPVQETVNPKSGNIRYLGHQFNLRQALTHYPNRKVIFAVRHPVSLFVSGFNSRLRKGRPKYFMEWTPVEEVAFSLFQSANDLAEALSSSDPFKKGCAELSMHSIFHLNRCLKAYLIGSEFLAVNAKRIGFIFDQNTLDEDLRVFIEKAKLSGHPGAVKLANAEKQKHATPDTANRRLSDVAIANLERWYETDIKIHEWCLQNKDEINSQH